MTFRTGKRDNETHRKQVRIGVHTRKSSRGRSRGIVISALVASAVAAVMILAVAPTSLAVASLAPDFSGDGSSPTPTRSSDMPGMDHGSGDAPEPGQGTGDIPESDHEAGNAAEESDRPLAAVLGAFGGGTSAVMLTAGFLRRKDRAADRVKTAARAARRSQK